MVARMFLVFQYTTPHSRAPNILPGKAIRLPRPSRLRSREATKATPTPHHGPSSTAQVTLTMCWMGAHLLPNIGKLNTLPTTHRAHSIPARASFFTERFFIRECSFPKRQRRPEPAGVSADSPHPHRAQNGTPGAGYEAVEACWPPLTPEHGFPSLTIPRLRALPLSPLRAVSRRKKHQKSRRPAAGPPAKNHLR